MKLLLDEMHSPRVADALRAQGWDAIAVAAESTRRGRPDTELFEFAIETGRVIVTEDSGGFIRLANLSSVEGKPHYGLIITSRARFPRGSVAYPNTLITALRNFLAAPPAESDTWIRWL